MCLFIFLISSQKAWVSAQFAIELLVAQRRQRIYLRRLARGQPAGHQCRDDEQRCDDGEDQRFGPFHALKSLAHLALSRPYGEMPARYLSQDK
jgi:hypothetical protein